MCGKRKYILFFVFILSISSCRKDKIQEPVVEDPTKWELISGEYEVYDTVGEYLYDLEIEYFQNNDTTNNQIRDIFRFVNFDGEFTFQEDQYSEPVYYFDSQFYLELGSHDTLFDSDGNRWKLFGSFEEKYNLYHSDTIHLKFKKTNINYYLHDLVPYYECECKQVAVKKN